MKLIGILIGCDCPSCAPGIGTANRISIQILTGLCAGWLLTVLWRIIL